MKIKSLLFGALLLAGNSLFAQFTQKPLPYAFNALEPYIDARTMEIHYTQHHATYLKNLNEAVGSTKESLENILKTQSKDNPAIRNNGGGHYNHELFWSVLAPESVDSEPSAELNKAIISKFKSMTGLRNKLIEAATKRFGSGWTWLVVDENGGLFITSTSNQDNPLMNTVSKNGTPIFGIDVWEHAYYLKYQNRRSEYLDNIWHLINWTEVSRRYAEAVK